MSPNLLKILEESEFVYKKDQVQKTSNNLTPINLHNFERVFEEWKQLAAPGHDTQTYVSTFFADLSEGSPTSPSVHNRADFWHGYEKVKDILSLVKHKDRLVELWSRRTEGEFFTPMFYASLGHEYLSTADPNIYESHWWDMCCGTGNLTKPCPEHTLNNLYLSTLNQEDADILAKNHPSNTTIFAQDFLNTGFDYDFLKLSKNWVFILNPPYSASPTMRDEHKHGVASTLIGDMMRDKQLNKASSNLTTQFLWKILQIANQYEINITVGMFTQISFVMSPSYAKFYQEWLKTFGFVNGFCFHCSEFEGTTGEWPVVFSVWSTKVQNNRVFVDIYENRKIVGEKEFSTPEDTLSKWIDRPKNTKPSVPFTSAITVADPSKTINLTKLPESALGFAVFAANDVMHSKQSYILSAPYANGSGWGITAENFEDSMVAVGSRAIIKGTWLNDRDQFGVPDMSSAEYELFRNDMIVWLLFGNFNHSASLLVEYGGENVDIVNHMFWKPGRFAGDWLQDKEFSQSAVDLMTFCNVLYDELQQYKSKAESKYQLDRWDAGWYQWRKALCGQNAPNKTIADMYTQYKKKHKLLTSVLIPQIYSLGILPQEIYFDKMKNSKQVRLHSKH